MATEPQFIDRDVAAIVADLVAAYEAETGKTLQPAQPERLLINAFAYREGLIRQAIQDASVQNLVAFSSAPVLDYLGELVGVKRLAASPAQVALTFTLVNGHSGVTIPRGTRVSSVDGKVVFITKAAASVNAGTFTKVVDAECSTPGAIGNGFTIGSISVLMDPLAFVVSVTNAAATSAGADLESDANLRERIKLAPESFSVAGSKGAYKYWAKTANAGIVDVAVTSPNPGDVYIYPMMAFPTGNTSAGVLAQVEAICSGEKVRPLTDTVVVASPSFTLYAIAVELVVLDSADQDAVKAQVEANIEAFALERRSKLGQDVVDDAIVAQCMVPGVYSVTMPGWSNIVCSETQFAQPDLDNFTVTITGTNPG